MKDGTNTCYAGDGHFLLKITTVINQIIITTRKNGTGFGKQGNELPVVTPTRSTYE